jgi:periplasmic protein TonB
MDRRHRWLKRAPVLGAMALVMLLVGSAIWAIRDFLASQVGQPQQMVEHITLVTPPPPPPPPIEKPPPPPPKMEQQVVQKQLQPTPKNAPTPPAPRLGLDAQGAAGGDGFGLLARSGGTALVGGNGAVFAWYTGKLRDQVLQCLSHDSRLRALRYSVSLRVWVNSDGRIGRVSLVDGSGNASLDGAITRDLSAMQPLGQSPPIEMPQPVTMKIVSTS